MHLGCACLQALRTIYDEYNDEEIVLTKEELEMIMRIRKGQFPSVAVSTWDPGWLQEHEGGRWAGHGMPKAGGGCRLPWIGGWRRRWLSIAGSA